MAATSYFEALPATLQTAPGTRVSLGSLLEQSFGGAAASINGAWLSYESPASLSSLTGFTASYWEPGNPSVTRWLRNGTDIGEGRASQIYVSKADFGSIELLAGNSIAPSTYITVEESRSGSTAYNWYSVGLVPPGLQVSSTFAPTSADIVASALRFDAAYHGVANTSDCAFISQAITRAAGAAMPPRSQSLTPSENEEGGFWRIAYRGSDPGQVADWTRLLQPGDVVRVDWNDPATFHTATIVSTDATGFSVVDNGLTSSGGIGLHRAYGWNNIVVPGSVTIYRVAADGMYLIQRGADNDLVLGTSYADLVRAGAGDDLVRGGAGADRVYGNAGSDVLYGNEDDDGLYGGQGTDSLFGGRGNDQVYGNLGDDLLFGNLGEDVLSGGQGNDTLSGGQGNDTLNGNLGNDLLSGNLGADRYVFGQGSGTDRVNGFSLAEGDRLDVQGQSYSLGTGSDGFALLTLSGGGTIALTGIAAGQVNASFFA